MNHYITDYQLYNFSFGTAHLSEKLTTLRFFLQIITKPSIPHLHTSNFTFTIHTFHTLTFHFHFHHSHFPHFNL